MNKPRFKVGDLVYWRSHSEEDVGLAIKVNSYYVGRTSLDIFWLASNDGITREFDRTAERRPGEISLFTHEEWLQLESRKVNKNEQV